MIYFIQAGENGPIKIGLTADAGSLPTRKSMLQVGNHARLRVVHVMEGGRNTEELLHELLSPYCIGGEWFEFDAAMNAVERNRLNPDFPHCPVMKDCDNGGMLVSRGEAMRNIYGKNASFRD